MVDLDLVILIHMKTHHLHQLFYHAIIDCIVSNNQMNERIDGIVIITLRLAINGDVFGDVKNGLHISSSFIFLSHKTNNNSNTNTNANSILIFYCVVQT